ncbi:helix-turn-helix transcriptional regulator [Nocardia sp. SYP-A9097]|uniref:ArsR/SmtB family transcription factor n=1 Tax=Nocardia sp. SYP-A9097 TaxID=2663237 RepID=UPI001E39230C|nr:metalloregulator ArsR/SmtB family transcription factor [Nocardia sp. SYP-A9097]
MKSGTADRVFGALANPTRRDLLELLLAGEQSVQALAEHFDMARPSVSEHLKVLREAGLVAEDKRGRQRFYRVEPHPLHELQSWLDPFERYWRERLHALGEVLDTMPDNPDSDKDHR